MTMARPTKLGVFDELIAHPIYDQIVPLAVAIAWYFQLHGSAPADGASRIAFYVGVATLAALVLTAATFVCALTYQSTAGPLVTVRERFGGTLRRNWISVIISTLFVAALVLVAVLVDSTSSRVAMSSAVYGLVLVVLRGFRSVYWLQFSLFMQHVSDNRTEPYVVSLEHTG